MGCDIHLFVEVRDGNVWKTADRWSNETDHDESGNVVTYRRINYDHRFYTSRNYDLFAMLANVRNGRGFAGCKTGEGFIPICEPRGLPEDVCQLVRDESDSWGVDGHSHSWLTVAELMAYDWTQVSIKTGVVDAITYARWVRWGKNRGESPQNYSGAVFGGSVKHVTEQQMAKLVADKKEEDLPTNVYCQVEWTQPYYARADEFLSHTLPRLWRLGKPEDVRIVFWFDN